SARRRTPRSFQRRPAKWWRAGADGNRVSSFLPLHLCLECRRPFVSGRVSGLREALMKAVAGGGRLGVAEPPELRAAVAKLRANASRQAGRASAFSGHYGKFATRAGARRGTAGVFQPRDAAPATHPRGVVADADLLDLA